MSEYTCKSCAFYKYKMKYLDNKPLLMITCNKCKDLSRYMTMNDLNIIAMISEKYICKSIENTQLKDANNLLRYRVDSLASLSIKNCLCFNEEKTNE